MPSFQHLHLHLEIDLVVLHPVESQRVLLAYPVEKVEGQHRRGENGAGVRRIEFPIPHIILQLMSVALHEHVAEPPLCDGRAGGWKHIVGVILQIEVLIHGATC